MRERPVPPLLRGESRKHKESHHKRPKAQEKAVAAAIGGKKTPGSGSGPDKGDVDRDVPLDSFPFKVECKRSMGKKSIRLELSHLTKITNEAYAVGAYPALDLQFDEEVVRSVARAQGKLPAATDWVAIPLTTFRAMLEALEAE